ncbi:MAG: hypothetical protein EKK29_14095 [Hyphomicrobiales bacterium]|nr:MAG: hypothetical protein EKK29_14095 [Hyphomicrobiales bacterium]
MRNQTHPASENETPGAAGDPEAADAERRAILAGLGKLAALTPPTVVTLLMSQRASAQSINPPPPDPN